jgi:2-polyprenyl-3-methyl-5-hydroxy-6-metoxy-1,4-benzoquinol methylase
MLENKNRLILKGDPTMVSQALSPPEHHDVCPWWKAYTFDNPIRKLFHPPRKVLGAYISGGMTVMDVGCGMGHFSIGMATLVGENGKVIAVDLQQKMLNVMLKRAKRAGMVERIRPHLCEADNIGVEEKVDFILAFWMVHEVNNQTKYFEQLRTNLSSESKILIAEPKFHITAKELERTIETAESCGLQCLGKPDIRFSLTALFEAT